MKFIRIIHKDTKGLVVRISELLAEKTINIDKIDAHAKDGFARIRLYTSDNDKALSVLNEAGYRGVPDMHILVKISDKPGELARVSRLLYDNDMDIRSITMIGQSEDENIVAIVTDQDDKAKSVLEKYLIS